MDFDPVYHLRMLGFEEGHQHVFELDRTPGRWGPALERALRAGHTRRLLLDLQRGRPRAQGLSELVRVRLCAGCKIDDREAREVKPVVRNRVLPVKVIAKKLST